jgi:hypothetical protein
MFKFNLINIVLLTLIVVFTKPVFSDSNYDTNSQTNQTGSNTQITGGYTSTTTNNNDGQTNTTTSTTTNTSTLGVGISGGKHFRDLNCERIKLSKVLYDYGMKVAAVSILCQDERVFEAMLMAGTPCPFEGKIGKDAIEQWNKYDVERPDYDSYVSKLETRSKIDEELAEIQRQEEAKRIAEENAKKLHESKIEEKKEVIEEQPVINVHE